MVVAIIEKSLADVWIGSVTFADDLAIVGATLSVAPTVTASGGTLAATRQSWTAAGVVTIQISGGKVDGVGEVKILATYSDTETIERSVLVSIV